MTPNIVSASLSTTDFVAELVTPVGPSCPNESNEDAAMTPASGQASLQVRQAYFRHRRSRFAGGWGVIAVWVGLGTLISWFFLVGLTGLGH
jgi:hypothetical protein